MSDPNQTGTTGKPDQSATYDPVTEAQTDAAQAQAAASQALVTAPIPAATNRASHGPERETNSPIRPARDLRRLRRREVRAV